MTSSAPRSSRRTSPSAQTKSLLTTSRPSPTILMPPDLSRIPAGKAIVEGVAELLRRWEAEMEKALGEEAYERTLGELEEAREYFLRERVRQAADVAVNAPFSGMPYFY